MASLGDSHLLQQRDFGRLSNNKALIEAVPLGALCTVICIVFAFYLGAWVNIATIAFIFIGKPRTKVSSIYGRFLPAVLSAWVG